MQNGGQVPPFFIFCLSAFGAPRKKRKIVLRHPLPPAKKLFPRLVPRVTRSGAAKKNTIKQNLATQARIWSSNFVSADAGEPPRAKKSSRRALPARWRRGPKDSPSAVSVLARSPPFFRQDESPTRLLVQKFSRRILLRRYGVLCIVEAGFQGFLERSAAKSGFVNSSAMS
jgi:hypothetical protein